MNTGFCGYWLRHRVVFQKLDNLCLLRRGFGVLLPAGSADQIGDDGVAGDGGQVFEQSLEAVNRKPVGAAFGAGFAFGRGRGLLGGDDIGALGAGGLVVVFVKEHGFEGGAHVPLHVVGQDAQEDVASDMVFVAAVDGTHFEIHGLDAAKPSLAGAGGDSLSPGSPQGVLCQGGTRRQRVFHQAEVRVRRSGLSAGH